MRRGYGWGDKNKLKLIQSPQTENAREIKKLNLRSRRKHVLSPKVPNKAVEQKLFSAIAQREREGKENKTQVHAPPPVAKPQQQQQTLTEQKVRVFALGRFEQLLQVVAPGSLVVLDIDETLIITRNMPSLLLGSSGVVAFQKYVQKAFPDFESRNRHCRALQGAIKDKTLVEQRTATVIKTLQDRGCRVFALTARYSELAERTERVLGNLDISFVKSAPFPSHPMRDPVTEAVVMRGIVYCNGVDKGQVLSRLLSSVIMPREAKLNNDPIPAIHFVDDRLEHTLSVRNALQTFPGLKIPSAICFHYRSPISLLSDQHKSLPDTNPELLPFIMDHFVRKNEVLSNTRALDMMNRSSNADAPKTLQPAA